MKEAAHISHSQDSAYDQHQNRSNKIHHLTFALLLRLACIPCSFPVAFPQSALLSNFHFAEVQAGNADKHHHQDGQKCIQVIGYRGQEYMKAIDIAHL